MGNDKEAANAAPDSEPDDTTPPCGFTAGRQPIEDYEGANPFEYVAPSQEQIAAIQTVRSAIKFAYFVMLTAMPESHERSVAIQKLEEASMWANKGIVFADDQTRYHAPHKNDKTWPR